MSGDTPTHVTVETATGRGAVAVVRAEGPLAVAAVNGCFVAANRKSLGRQPTSAIRFGRWLTPDGEEVVVCRRQENTVEVHCHGGLAAVQAVVGSLVARGCAEQNWRGSLHSTAVSRVSAEAALALRHAITERTASILLDQTHGAMDRALRSASSATDASGMATQLDNLLCWSNLGGRLTSAWSVVLTGAPNVGKSSLINAMLGFARAIVFDQPGTTRDVVTADAAIEGWPIRLADTAGLRESADSTEAAGVALAKQAVADADLVIEVRDTTCPKDLQLEIPSGQIVVWNKVDLAAPPAGQGGVETSAATGQGVEPLLAAVAAALVPSPPTAGQAIPVSEATVTSLVEAKRLANQGNLKASQAVVQAMLAPSTTYDGLRSESNERASRS